MSGFDRINVQKRQFLTVPRDHNSVICCQISFVVEQIASKRPPNFYWQIALCYDASSSDGFIKIYILIVAK
jgi:hypothetical protein